MKWMRVISVTSCLALLTATTLSDDLLGKGKGKGGGGGGGSQTGGGSGGGKGNGGGSGGGSGGGGGLGKGGGGGGGSTSGGGTGGSGGRGGGSNSGGGGSSSGGGLGNLGKGGGSNGGGSGGSGGRGGSGSGQVGSGGSGGRGNSGLGNQGNVNTGGGRSGDVLGKVNGRSGTSRYNTQSNNGTNQRFEFGRDRISLERGSLPSQVRREDNIQITGANGRWRVGYYHYDNRWRDDYFCYPHYTFTPYGNNCTVSPWYYYPQLPGYIVTNRIIFLNGTNCNWNAGVVYNWSRDWNNGNSRYDDRYDRYDGRDRYLDESVRDIVRAFEDRDRRSLDRVVPRNGRVNIYVDGSYTYSLGSDDYYDLMVDNIYNSRTNRYDITSVRTYRGAAQVAARHEFLDSWGRRATMYHYYRLEEDRDGYYITDFMSSRWAYGTSGW